MAKYDKKDCRNHGGQIKTPVSKYPKLVKGCEWFTGKNRHDRRTAKHFAGVRKNTKGFPIGFNKITWNQRCAELAYLERQQDASRGRSL